MIGSGDATGAFLGRLAPIKAIGIPLSIALSPSLISVSGKVVA